MAKDRIYCEIETIETSFHGKLELEYMRSDFTTQTAGILTVSEYFPNHSETEVIVARNFRQFELKLNKVLYNLFPDDEIFWIQWNSEKGFRKLTKIPKDHNEISHYYQYCKDNNDLFLTDTEPF